MKESIIKQMHEIVRDTMTNFQSDFEADKKTLEDYDGRFFWSCAATHTRIFLIDAKHIMQWIEDRRGLYALLQGRFMPDYMTQVVANDEHLFYYDGESEYMTLISIQSAVGLWKVTKDAVIAHYTLMHGENSIPKSFKIPVKFVCSLGYVREQLKFAEEIGTDSLKNLLHRFRNWAMLDDTHYIEVSKDFSERSFTFASISVKDGEETCDMNGGILFYDGAWHMHT